MKGIHSQPQGQQAKHQFGLPLGECRESGVPDPNPGKPAPGIAERSPRADRPGPQVPEPHADPKATLAILMLPAPLQNGKPIIRSAGNCK